MSRGSVHHNGTMAPLTEILVRLETLLEPGRFEDPGPNGLQIRGRDDISRVLTAVSATRAAIDRAVEIRADLMLVHHGLFWGPVQGLSPLVAERLRPLFKHDIALAAYHLPLDAHPEVGNNALLADALGADSHEGFADIGRSATFAGEGIAVAELTDRVRAATGGREPLLQGSGPPRVRRVAVVSGSGAGYLEQAAATGHDALLTGEPREQTMGEAEEAGLHFIAAGHWATETRGVRRLGELIAEEFGVEHEFADLPNPV